MRGPTLFFDRNVGKSIPEALRLLGWDAVHHHSRLGGRSSRSLFAHNEKDDKWLEHVGKEGWIVITQDRKFHLTGFENELSATKQFNVGCFYIWGAQANKWEKMKALCRGLEPMVAAAALETKPFIYDVGRTGRLKKIIIP